MDLISPLQINTGATPASATPGGATPTASQQQQDAFLSALTAALGRPGVLAGGGGDDDDTDDGSSLTVGIGV